MYAQKRDSAALIEFLVMLEREVSNRSTIGIKSWVLSAKRCNKPVSNLVIKNTIPMETANGTMGTK